MDTHGMKFVVDTSQVEKGLRDYRSAVEGIFSSLDKFEDHVKKTMAGVAKAAGNQQNLNKFRKSLGAFSDVKIDTRAAGKITKLSEALNKFKAPSAAQSKNASTFFKAMAGMPDLTATYKSAQKIKNLSAALDGFKAPSSAQAKRMKEFGRALQAAEGGFKALGSLRNTSTAINELAWLSDVMRKFKAPTKAQTQNIGLLATALGRLSRAKGGDISHLTRTLTAISGFKAPTGAQVKNLSNFVDAIGKMRVPRNANELASALVRIARASNSAAQSVRTLRGGLRGSSNAMRQLSRDSQKARVNMMGLQNSFSATFQIGSALRSLFGALTVAELARNFLKASNTALRFRAQMAAISTDAGFAATQLDWVNESAQRLGLDMLTAEQGFGRLSIAASKSGLSVATARDIFTGFGTAMTVLGTTTERQNDVLLALQQVMNKGYLAAEELNQQLNEHLPGAMAIAASYAAELGVTLEEGLKKKMLDAEGVLTHMAKTFRTEFGPALEESLKRPDVAFTQLINRVNLFMQKVGEFGANDALGALLNEITAGMDEQTIENYARAVGESLANAIDAVRESIVWLKENWDSLKGPISATLDLLAKWMIISGSLQIAKLITIPVMGAYNAFKILGTGIATTRAVLAVLTASSIPAAITTTNGMTTANNAATLSALRFRNALATHVATMRAAAASSGILAAAQVGLAGAIGAATKAVKGFNAAGGPWLVLLGAVTYAAWDMWDAQKASSDAVAGTSDFIKKQNATLQEHRDKMFFVNEQTAQNNVLQRNLSTAMSDATGFMEAYKTKLDEVTGGLYSMALAAKEAMIANAQLARTNAILEFNKTAGGSSTAMRTAAHQSWDDGMYARAFGQSFRAGGIQLGQFIGLIDGEEKKLQSIRDLAGQVETTSNLLAEAQAYDPAKGALAEAERRRALGIPLPGAAAGPAGREDDDAGGGSGGRSAADKAAREMEKLRRDAESLMGVFSEVDPLGQLRRDFSTNLFEMGRALLNDNGFSAYSDRLMADVKQGKLSVDGLIESLQNTGNQAPKMIQELANAHGVSVEQLISLLRAEQAKFERSVRDSIQAQLEVQYAPMQGLIGMLSDGVPEINALREALDQLGPIAKEALGDDQFSTFMDSLLSGGTTAFYAVDDLKTALEDASGVNAGFLKLLDDLGLEITDVVAMVDRVGGSIARARRDAERSQTFGGDLLQDLDNEIALLSVREDQRDVMQALMDAQAAHEGTITPTMLQNLEKEVRARQAVADQLQRQNEFYENNGIRGYLNDIKQAGEAAQELDRNVLQSLEDQLYSLGTTGEFSFKAIFDTIQQGLVRFAAQDITRAMTEGLFSSSEIDGGNPTIFGGLLGRMGHEFKPADAPRGKNRAMPMFVEVTNMGALGLTSDGNAVFGPQGNITVGGNAGGKASIFKPGVANDNDLGITQTTEQMTENTARSFGDSMMGMMPMIGLAFAGSFKSPIAQVAAMFATMILPKLLGAGGGGGEGGLGGILQAGMGLFGGFKEGGMTGSPVTFHRASASMFANAPHYAEGTANTSGGMPAILHDNEAVIPLSRGRKVPVEMNDNGRGQVINNNWNISTPNADSFKKSRQQTVTDMHMVAQRSYSRNHG